VAVVLKNKKPNVQGRVMMFDSRVWARERKAIDKDEMIHHGLLAPIQSSLFIFFASSMTPMKPAMTSGTARIKQCIRGLGYVCLCN
jgi:hypothetical protein